MSFIEENLLPDEEILQKAEISWLIYLPALLWVVLSALVFYMGRFEMGITSKGVEIVTAFVLLIALAKFIDAALYQAFTELAVTSRRLVAKFGFISRKTFEWPFGNIESVNIDQSILERIAGCGTVTIHGTGTGIAPLRYISSPVAFRNELNNAIFDSNN